MELLLILFEKISKRHIHFYKKQDRRQIVQLSSTVVVESQG